MVYRQILWRAAFSAALIILAACAAPVPAAGPTNAGNAGTPASTPAAAGVTSTSAPTTASNAPTLQPTPPQPGAGQIVTITFEDNGRSITLETGSRLLLSLGTGYNWQASVDDPTILARLPTSVKDDQGEYEAVRPGQTTLSAIGSPPCLNSTPRCLAPTRLFRVQIVVVAASARTATAPQASLTVTQADNGKTLTLHVGQSFLLDLGDELDWKVAVADPNIVSRVVNILVVKGAQGVYQARQPGETTLTATGTVPCPPGEVCPQFALGFRINLVVQQ